MAASVEFIDRQTVISTAWLNAVNQALLAVVTKTTDYSMTNRDGLVYINCSGGARTITLPSNPEDGQIAIVKKVGSTANELIITGNGANVEGSSSYTPRTGATTDNVCCWFRYSADPNSSGWWEL